MTKQYTLAAYGYTFTQADPEKLGFVGTVPHSAFMMTLENLNSLALAKSALVDDSDLSGPGKERRLAPLYAKTWDMVCFAHVELATYQAATAQREAKLLSLPTLDNGATAVCLEDIEARSWYRSLPLDERTAIMNAMHNDPAAGLRFARLQIALLRSPVPLPLDREAEFFRNLWTQTARLNNPGEAVAIDGQKAAARWSIRGLAQLVGCLHGLTDWSRSDLLTFLVADAKRVSTGAALGFGTLDVASAQARHEAAKRTAVPA
jgi:hypothetical protein